MKFKDLVGSKSNPKQSKMKMVITESQMKRLLENIVDESHNDQNKIKQAKIIINEKMISMNKVTSLYSPL